MSGRARSSSSAGRARSSSGNGRSSNEDNTNHAIRIVRRKLRDSKIKVASIVHRCEVKDRNEDGLVHIDDLEDILNEVIPSKHRITRRELIRFSATIMSERNDGRIQYEKISDILEPKVKKVSEDENWVDIEDDEGDTKWATQPGSVGAFLKASACPSEIKNFKRFVACLEAFERDSGMKLHLKDDGGFSVPMGPDLRATITFSMV